MPPRPTVTFVSGNKNKVAEVRQILADVADVDNIKIDLPELQGDPDEISREKGRIAFGKVGRPVLVEDTSLEFHAMGGLPGPYIKWFLETLGHEGLNKMLVGFKNNAAAAACRFTLCTGTNETTLFTGKCEGRIVPARGPTNFGWDPVFEPVDGQSATGKRLTFAEMSAEEKNKISHRSRALAQLRQHLAAGGASSPGSPGKKRGREEESVKTARKGSASPKASPKK